MYNSVTSARGYAGFRQERRVRDEDVNIPDEDHNAPDPCELLHTIMRQYHNI